MAYNLIYHTETDFMERDNLMHGARTALNTDGEIRAWAENFLKEKTRTENPGMPEEEFEKYWRYHKPEIMHAGAAEAMQAYKARAK
jgi:hypothetical protein